MTMPELTELRSCSWTEDQGYNTQVEPIDGSGRYGGAKVVCLALGETRAGSFSVEAFSIMTPEQARDLAGDLNSAARKAEVENKQ